MTYLGERKLANFRDRTPKPSKNSGKAARRPGMSEAHLELIRQLPCCVCARGPRSECHHLKAGTAERGIGLRATDRWAVPMCHDCHMEVERAGSRNEQAWFNARGFSCVLLALDLWASTGNAERMKGVLIARVI